MEQIFEANSAGPRKNPIQTSVHLFWLVSRKTSQKDVSKGLRK
jgi:hypothetical protein